MVPITVSDRRTFATALCFVGRSSTLGLALDLDLGQTFGSPKLRPARSKSTSEGSPTFSSTHNTPQNTVSSMAIRKRNEYLDVDVSGIDDDDDENSGSAHEVAADSRTAGLKSPSSKRRKLTTTGPGSDGGPANDSDNIPNTAIYTEYTEGLQDAAATPDHVPNRLSSNPSSTTAKRTLVAGTSKPTHKPGVIYLSRIPPFMRPSTVKTLLSVHGPISKIFLTPEPPTTYLRRKKGGGNKKHSFIDGWVEFTKKKHAKQCVDAINGQIVGGKKGGFYRDDVWNARYLRGFGWGDLMQSVRAEEREREERVRVGTKREGRERGEFLRNLERSKVEATRREKKRKRDGQAEDGIGGQDEGRKERKTQDGAGEGRRKQFERRFRQNEVKSSGSKQTEQPDEVKRVLNKIF